ncbi:MAG: right-handed parallel beta-helix repeat-containing protein [bacterium]
MRGSINWITIIGIAVFLTVACNFALAATLIVGPTGYDYTSVQAAIDAAVNGDKVIVNNGIYTENIDFKGKAITVQSVNGPAVSIIDGTAKDRVIGFNNDESADSVLDGFTLQNGSSSYYQGGGIYCSHSLPTITNCIITGNTARYGGGISCTSQASPTITNCIIIGNKADDGGGIYCEDSSMPIITNCIIYGNNAKENGGGIYCQESSSPYIVNSILWNNSTQLYAESGSNSNPTLSYCDVQGGYSGLGNIDADPLFIDSKDGNYHLGDGSPCIDTAHPRIYDSDNSRSDMGAYGGDGGFDPNPINIMVAIDGSGDYTSIQDAIGYAISGDTIRVFSGIYKENLVIGGKDISLISQDIVGSVIIDGSSSGSVIMLASLGSNARLGGLILRNGTAELGGGIYCRNSSLTISKCNIIGNTAEWGGGIYCRYSSPLLTDCTFSNNFAENGGGIRCYGSSPMITNCTIGDNTAEWYGGGIYCYYSSPIITDCMIINNAAPDWGEGGGIYCEDSSPTLSNCTVSDNMAEWRGGGIYCDDSLSTITNCTISGNIAEDGGGIYCYYSSPVIVNCTITGNSASDSGGGISCTNSSPYIINTIFWDNGSEISSYYSNPRLSFCNINGGYPGLGNIDANPLFISPESGDYHLGEDSSCKDSGHPRIYDSDNSRSDMGTFGGDGGYDTNAADITVAIDGSGDYTSIQDAIDYAITGDIITVFPGVYKENLVIGGKDVSLISQNDTGSTIIDGSGNGTCMSLINVSSSFTLNKFTIENGLAENGGGIFCFYSYPKIINCTITRNNAVCGGGISCWNSSPIIINCTISGNKAFKNGGGAKFVENSSPTIINSILWGDMLGENLDEIYLSDNSSVAITYSDIQQESGVYPGTGNINADPLFVGDEFGNYYLEAGSPCIDAGNSNQSPFDDQEGILRPQEEGIDIGAYEYIAPASCIPRASFTVDETIGIGSLAVTFDATSSGGSQYSGASFLWDFGDGTSGSDLKVTHTYSKDGIHDVSLTITIDSESHKVIFYNVIKIKSPQVREVGIGFTYASIQDAINDAQYGEIILVHDGTYVENINYHGKTIRIHSDNGAAHTIIDGSAKGSVVIFNNWEGTDSVLDGFTIQNGSAEYGGGIYCSNSSPTITNCTISNNTASNEGEGGGIYCRYSSSTITNCIISDNTAEWYGGGISCYNSSPTITDCMINNNIAPDLGEGGGIYCDNSSPTLTNCIINDNMAEWAGGGIECYYSSPTITNCTINDNIASDEGYGGGIYCSYSSPTITNCTVVGNIAADGFGGGIECYNSSPTITNCSINANTAKWGGGIDCDMDSSPIITYCTISDNTAASSGGGIYCQGTSLVTGCRIWNNIAQSGGGGIFFDESSSSIINCIISKNQAKWGAGLYCHDSSPIITNCTISNNTAKTGGGIECDENSSPSIVNSILWGDIAGGNPHEIYLSNNSSITVTYSDIQQEEEIFPGSGNININPLFINSEEGNYHLKPDSPCIDAGTPSGAPSEDQEGISRPQGEEIDMGAYEYSGSTSCTPQAIFTANQTKGTDFVTVEFDASSSDGIQNGETEFFWQFGDGTTGSGLRASHNYSGYGTYDVSLTITTECGSHKATHYNLIKIKSSQITKEVGEGYPYASIQEAINDAQYGEILLVHDGTYIENINFQGKAVIIRSENGPENTVIDGNAIGSVIIFDHSEGEESVLDGFIIQNGSAEYGGGVYCYSASPTITNCIIKNNTASEGGGGIFCEENSSPVINNCSIITNTAKWGGSICCLLSSSPTITNCTISENTAEFGGGILCYKDSAPIINGNTIKKNRASHLGGGIDCYDTSSVKITNCIIHDNTAPYGGGIYGDTASAIIAHCTIVNNAASKEGGGIGSISSSLTITNCILWGNEDDLYDCSATYSNIQDGDRGEGNISADPLFVNLTEGDYHLQSISPCIDKGVSLENVSVDKDGVVRPLNGDADDTAQWDMGAYEFIPRAELMIETIEINPSYPMQRELISIQVTIKNTGLVDAENFQVDIYKHLDIPPSTAQKGDYSLQIDHLVPAASHTLSWDTTFNELGTYHLYVQIDTANQVLEMNEGNNIIERAIEIGSPQQQIILQAGWNLISFQVNRCFYDTKTLPSARIPNSVEYHKVSNMSDWLSTVIDSSWQRVVSFDQEGAHILDKSLPEEVNTLHYMSLGYGYWIEMDDTGTMTIEGPFADADTPLILNEGWNLIGYIPHNVCCGSKPQEDLHPYRSGNYREDEIIYSVVSQSVVSAGFGNIADDYLRVISFDPVNGAMMYDSDELSEEVNTIHYIGPKYGYWVKIKEH